MADLQEIKITDILCNYCNLLEVPRSPGIPMRIGLYKHCLFQKMVICILLNSYFKFYFAVILCSIHLVAQLAGEITLMTLSIKGFEMLS